MIRVLITDDQLATLGDPVEGWTSVEVDLRFNEPGGGTIVAPASADLLDRLQPGNRIVVVRDGAVFAAGPIEQIGPYEWAASGEHSPPGTIAVTFAEDLALIVARDTYPDPALTATNQTTDARWTATDLAGQIMLDLVDVNAGPSALTVRRVPRLITGAGAGLGTTVEFGTRFAPVGDELRSLAIAGGGLGFRSRQVDDDIVFDVYDPDDKSASVRFTPGDGSVRSFTFSLAAPRANAAVVAGSGEGTAREFVERTSADGWPRMEAFVDQRQAESTTELEQAGDEALADGAPTAEVTAELVDSDLRRFGVDFGLGDLVSFAPLPGFQVIEVVLAAKLTATAKESEVVSVSIGNTAASNSDPDWLRSVRDLSRRVGRLEAI